MKTVYLKKGLYCYHKYKEIEPENIVYEKALDDVFEIQNVLENLDKDDNNIIFLWKSETGWPIEYVTNNIENFGYTADEFISGKLRYADIIHPDDIKKVEDELNKVYKKNEPMYSNEYRVMTKSGEVRWVDGTSFIHRDENGNVTFFKGIITDITRQKNKDIELNSSIELRDILKTVIDNSPVVVFLWKIDRNWPADYVSNNISQFEYLPEDFTSGNVKHDDIIHSNDLKRVRLEFSRLCHLGYSEFTQEYRIITKSGKTRWINEDVIVQYNSKGSPVSYQSIMFDITDRKNKEVAIQQSLKEKKKFEDIINKSPVIVFQWKASDNPNEMWPVEYVSDNISQFGYSPDEFLKGKIQYGEIIHPDDLKRVQSELHEQHKKGCSEFSQEYRIITKSGDVKWLDERTFIQRDENGEPVYYQGILVDNTKHKFAENIIYIQHKIGSLLNSNNDVDETIEQVLEQVLEINAIDCGCIHFVAESGGLDLVTHKGLSASLVYDISHINSNSLITKLLMGGNPVYKDYSEIFHSSIYNIEHKKRALALIPIKYKGGIIATLSLSSHTYDEIPQEVKIAVENIADLLGGYIGRITAEIELDEYKKSCMLHYSII
ncbi:MAG: PAS domain-containing protein [Methanohalobium sp.]|uniref:PAS domain-containing protein n=1 Tax=Methanohalobium sp. TaxID=2837493 RepID=UPI00397AE494